MLQDTEQKEGMNISREFIVTEKLALLVGIRVGVRILGEVKGEHFADHTVALLWVEKK